LFAQDTISSSPRLHSHNDYLRDTPFYSAYRHGFSSIEADVFSVNNELLVAHDFKGIRADRTLKKLYLEPLVTELSKRTKHKVQLLVDVKGSPDTVLPLLVAQLRPLKRYVQSGQLMVLISGNRPLPANYARYSGVLLFDDDLRRPHNKQAWERVGLISLQFSVFSDWKGLDTIPAKDRDRLRRIINGVHAAGRSIRFWGAPDNEHGWEELMKLGVDFIGTDNIEGLSQYVKKK
jgi:alkaline phosphatase